MPIEELILGILLGWLRKGSLRNLSRHRFNALFLAIMAFGVQLVLNISAGRGLHWYRPWLIYLHLFSYLLLFIFLWLNRRLPWISLLALGFILNALVIGFNGGAMPVNPEGLRPGLVQALTEKQVATHQLINDETLLKPLADVILVTFPRVRRISLGDIIMSVGMILMIQQLMVSQVGYKSYQQRSIS